MTLSEQDLLEQLQVRATFLKPNQITLLLEMADSLCKTAVVWRRPKSVIVSEAFLEAFADRLLVHHAMGAEKFNKKPFEFAFVRAMRASGHEAIIAESGTEPGADVNVGGVRYSLKTEAAKKISPASITVSKLAEARWINRTQNPQDLINGIQTRILPRFKDYEHMLTLRAFDDQIDGSSAVRYELIEIPLDLLRCMTDIVVDNIKISTKNGGGSASVNDVGFVTSNLRQRLLFTLVFDGSVEKITIRNLRASACVHHASWTIPIPPEAALVKDDEQDAVSAVASDTPTDE